MEEQLPRELQELGLVKFHNPCEKFTVLLIHWGYYSSGKPMTCALRLYRNACLAAPHEGRVKEPKIGGKSKKLRNKTKKELDQIQLIRHEVLHS